jgi:hypothetical protein
MARASFEKISFFIAWIYEKCSNIDLKSSKFSNNYSFYQLENKINLRMFGSVRKLFENKKLYFTNSSFCLPHPN